MVDQIQRRLSVERAVCGLALSPGVTIRPWAETDFPAVQDLPAAEGWPTPVERPDDTLAAWRHSWPALVAVARGEVVGFLRGLTDGYITLYVAELLVAPRWRGRGVGTALIEVAQRLYPSTRIDLLGTETSASYYETHGYRPFRGFRKSRC